MDDETRGFQEGERIAKISIWTLLALGIVEITFSLISGSISLLADGIDSISDAVVSFFVWAGLRISRVSQLVGSNSATTRSRKKTRTRRKKVVTSEADKKAEEAPVKDPQPASIAEATPAKQPTDDA